MKLGTAIYATLAGEWGWACGDCRAESRYVYGERATARHLAMRHERKCKGRVRETVRR